MMDRLRVWGGLLLAVVTWVGVVVVALVCWVLIAEITRCVPPG